MVVTLVFAVGLPLWLLGEEVMRLRAARSTQELGQTVRASKPVGVVLSRGV